MRKPYHICMSGGDELICRSEEDYARLFNCVALAAYETDSVLLADAEMSSHMHLGVRTEYPDEFLSRVWLMYTRYFNNKYKRLGRLGEEGPFVLELEGLHHILAALCYILRNPLHHGLSATPFGYPFSSANIYFRNELGKWHLEDLLPEKSWYRHLPRLSFYPSGFKMTKSGVYLRESVMDVAEVENMFVTPRSFMYYMNRLSGEEWRAEQEKDMCTHPPVTLDVIERGITLQSLNRMLANENGRSNYKAMSDISLCSIIDTEILPDSGRKSVYDMTRSQISDAIRYLRHTFSVSETQACRCLAFSYPRR